MSAQKKHSRKRHTNCTSGSVSTHLATHPIQRTNWLIWNILKYFGIIFRPWELLHSVKYNPWGNYRVFVYITVYVSYNDHLKQNETVQFRWRIWNIFWDGLYVQYKASFCVRNTCCTVHACMYVNICIVCMTWDISNTLPFLQSPHSHLLWDKPFFFV